MDSRNHAVTILITGESGVGKSTLVQRFLQDVAQHTPNALVLQARCYEREIVPYKGIDGIVDAMSQHLSRTSETQVTPLLPGNLAALARLFPALARVRSIHVAVTADTSGLSEQEQRLRGFRALRGLLQNMASLHPLIVSIDDLQWADIDSWQLLRELLAEPNAPRLLFVGTQRGLLATETTDTLVTNMDTWPGRVEMLQLGHLEPKAARNLASALLDTKVSQQRIQALVHESGGHPLFLAELCHFVQLHQEQKDPILFEQALKVRLDALDSDARNLLHIIAVAGTPLPQSAAVAAAKLIADRADDALQKLSTGRFIQTHGSQSNATIESYHDRIRSSVVGEVASDQRVSIHHALATTLEQCSSPNEQMIATHWHGAGQFKKACRYWIRAADKAAQTLAFDQAARLYKNALDIQRSHAVSGDVAFGELRIKLAEALANAGSVRKAARLYQEGAQHARGKRAVALQQRAAALLLTGGHIDAGIATLSPILQQGGFHMPASARQTVVAFLRARLQLRLENPRLCWTWTHPQKANPALLDKADICWDAALGLLNIDQLRGILFHTHALIYILRAGEPYRVSRALITEALTAAALNNDQNEAHRLLDQARSIATQLHDNYLLAYALLVESVIAMFSGHWRTTLRLLNNAQKRFKTLPRDVSWELTTCEFISHGTQFTSGLWTETKDSITATIQKAKARGNLYHAAAAQLGPANLVWLMDDDPEEAAQQVANAVKGWSQQGIHLQHLLEVIAHTHINLYQGEYSNAFHFIGERWKSLRKSGLLRLQFNRILSLGIYAQTALACVFANTPETKHAYRRAKRNAKQLMHESASWAHGLATLIQAQLAYHSGSKNTVPLFQEATERLDALDMPIQATASLACQTYLQEGIVSAKVFQAACLRTVKKPLRFLSIYAPLLQILRKKN